MDEEDKTSDHQEGLAEAQIENSRAAPIHPAAATAFTRLTGMRIPSVLPPSDD
jgi:hypothetical protein